MIKPKHLFPAYSQGLCERANDPWLRLLQRYRTIPIRPYQPQFSQWLSSNCVGKRTVVAPQQSLPSALAFAGCDGIRSYGTALH